MKVGSIVTASDLNPLYCEFIPAFVTAWKKLLPEADIHIVLIADAIPAEYAAYSEYIRLFPPVAGLHTAFQAQCIRLLYPRQITRDEGVLITDMDMLPMSRKYYVDTIAPFPSSAFVVYRDVCLPHEISMCYNVAHPAIWTSLIGDADTQTLLREWYPGSGYNGAHIGSGWSTDQHILVQKFNEWSGQKIVLNDKHTGFRRLDRSYHREIFLNLDKFEKQLSSEIFADYHCLRPFSRYRDINQRIVNMLPTYTL